MFPDNTVIMIHTQPCVGLFGDFVYMRHDMALMSSMSAGPNCRHKSCLARATANQGEGVNKCKQSKQQSQGTYYNEFEKKKTHLIGFTFTC